MIINIKTLIIYFLGTFGIFFGSFINASVWRSHEGISWNVKRSKCDYCKHVLGLLDLVPVLSWIFLRGRCRYCNKKISWQYPTSEIVTAGIFIGLYSLWNLSYTGLGLFQLISWFIFLSIFIWLSIYDFKWQILPDKVVILFTTIVLIYLVTVFATNHNLSMFLGSLFGGLLIAGVFYLLFQMSSGKWIGGGDVKLSIGLGILSGSPINAITVIFIASLLGTLSAIPLIVKYKRKDIHIPFGPFLMLATVIVMLFHHNLSNWYLGLIGK